MPHAIFQGTGAMTTDNVLLQVEGVRKYFPVTKGTVLKKLIGYVKAVDGVSFPIRQGETFGLVGESGCGKTTIAKMILLIESPSEGSITYEGKHINSLKGVGLKHYESSVQVVFQDPYASLDPRMRLWKIITEPLKAVQNVSTTQAKERAAYLLETVGLSPGALNLYPHQFSGGQRQRIAIARALSSDPKFLVLDEPVSALDVSIRAQIMNLLKDIQKKFDLTMFIIAHDLGVIRYMSDTIGVMYLGRIVEIGPADRVCSNPLHPYTQSLLASALSYDPDVQPGEQVITGEVPSPFNPPSGCSFHPRCPFVMEHCSKDLPALKKHESGQKVACYLYSSEVARDSEQVA